MVTPSAPFMPPAILMLLHVIVSLWSHLSILMMERRSQAARSTQWSCKLFSGTTPHPWQNNRYIPWYRSKQYSWFCTRRWCVHCHQHQRTDKICMMTTRLACNGAIESSYQRMDNNSDVGLLMGYVLYRLPIELESMDLDTFSRWFGLHPSLRTSW
jgi:hypothetical protein